MILAIWKLVKHTDCLFGGGGGKTRTCREVLEANLKFKLNVENLNLGHSSAVDKISLKDKCQSHIGNIIIGSPKEGGDGEKEKIVARYHQ